MRRYLLAASTVGRLTCLFFFFNIGVTLLPAFQNIVLIYSESLQTMKIDIILKTG